MKQALFFVTSANGIKKPQFKSRMGRVIEDGYDVRVIVAILDVADSQYAKSYIEKVAKGFHGEKQVSIKQIYDLFENEKGIKNPVDDVEFDLEPYDVTKRSTEDRTVYTYADEDGRVMAEMIQDQGASNEYKLVIYDGAKALREIYFNKDERPVAVKTFIGKGNTNTKILNNRGEISVYFTKKKGGPVRVYNLNKTSVIKAPAMSKAIPKHIDLNLNPKDVDMAVGNQKHIVKANQTSSYVVLDYADAQRFDDLASFNVNLIEKYMGKDTMLFIDLKDTLDFSAYLDRQVIFNY